MNLTKGLKTIVVICLMAVSAIFTPSAAAGESSFGPHIGYVSRNESAIAGVTFQYSFSQHVRIAPSADIIFRHRDKDGLMVNIDMQFPYSLTGTRVAFYPLIGVNYTSWGLHDHDFDHAKDVTTHLNRLGFNAGAGLDIRCTSSLKLGLEARYTLMHRYPTAAVLASIAFVF